MSAAAASPPGLPAQAGPTLLALARGAIADRLGADAPLADDLGTWLDEPGATFVTLTRDAHLRGCIGSLQARRSLREDVRDNAVAAATRDPRFPPLHADELRGIRVEVSLLSPAVPLEVETEEQAVRALHQGVDGVVLQAGSHRATYLPQVWRQLPDPRDFLASLRRKAGLGPERRDGERLAIYTVTSWHEEE
ncbi:MAG: AmmeMemoRadiSam system protein A [Micrococcales bacterium]|nr:AmmeMemoRadiSam system protein A [Micrococcales bacterium]